MAHNLKLQWQIDGHNHEQIIPMGGKVVIGRGDTANIVLADPHVSRQHASISGSDGHFYVCNLSQSNPVFLQETSTTKQLNFQEASVLSTGQVIRIGKIELHVAAIEAAPEPKPASKEITLKIRCSQCQRVVDGKHKDCPWCGTALAFGSTVYNG